MATLGTIGRFVYAIPFLVFASFHFMQGAAMAGMVPVPGGVIWVYLTGVAMAAASIAIMTGKMASLASTLLGVLLLSYVLTIHLPGVLGAADQAAMQASMSSLLKDTALAGGAFVLAGVFASGGSPGRAGFEPAREREPAEVERAAL